MTGTAHIIRGNALALPLPDESVDLIITSPPYFGLRSYQDGGKHYDGQIGAEATPAEFVDALIAATAEMVRVLKSSGSIWVNLGDKYNSAASGQNGSTGGLANGPNYERMTRRGATTPNIRPKSLIGIPWRYALRAIDDLGLILRAEIIWSKSNGLPESVTDRVRRSHETWFHFTKSPRYYSAVDEIREPHSPLTYKQAASDARSQVDRHVKLDATRETGKLRQSYTPPPNPLGKLPGSVWEIPTQPLTVPDHLGVDHFAAFPMEWPRRIIRGWSPSGVCTACGQGRRPVMHTDRPQQSEMQRNLARIMEDRGQRGQGQSSTIGIPLSQVHREITGYACACPDTTAPTTPAVILDPFGGTGTTALAAKALGRHGISIDMSADYCRLARWRTTDPGQLASAMQVDKPATPLDGQMDLLEGLLA